MLIRKKLRFLKKIVTLLFIVIISSMFVGCGSPEDIDEPDIEPEFYEMIIEEPDFDEVINIEPEVENNPNSESNISEPTTESNQVLENDFSQAIIGEWEQTNNETGQDHYQAHMSFFVDGSFRHRWYESSLGGTYEIVGNEVQVTVTHMGFFDGAYNEMTPVDFAALGLDEIILIFTLEGVSNDLTLSRSKTPLDGYNQSDPIIYSKTD
jgi:hypothetical protein